MNLLHGVNFYQLGEFRSRIEFIADTQEKRYSILMKRKLNAKGYMVLLACLIYSLILYNALDFHSFAYATRIAPFYYITELLVIVYYITNAGTMVFLTPLILLLGEKASDKIFCGTCIAPVPIITTFTTFVFLSAFLLVIFNKWLFTDGVKPIKRKVSETRRVS